MVSRRVGLSAVAVAAASVALVGASTYALADTVESPIGRLTAEQYRGNYCDDFGATVQVDVTDGARTATYSAKATGVFSGGQSLRTNAAGAGHVVLHNVTTPGGGIDGIATVTVSHSGTTVDVAVKIFCQDPSGG